MTPEELAAYLERHGLTGPQLAERLGTTRMTVNRWVRGESPINRITTYALRHLETIMTTEQTIIDAAQESAQEAWDQATESDRQTIATWDAWPMPGDIEALQDELGAEPTHDQVVALGDAIRAALAGMAK